MDDCLVCTLHTRQSSLQIVHQVDFIYKIIQGYTVNKIQVFQKELYNFESLQKFIQRTYTRF